MATYGRGQMLGSGINPESFKQDYSGFTRAAEMQAQGLSNLGGSIAGAIKDYGQAKQERKKLDAGIKATITGIESAIKMGDSLGIDVKSSLTPYLDKINDPNVTPIEAAAYAQEASSAINNILNFGMKANQLGMEEDQNIRAARIKQAELEAAANKPGPIEAIAVRGGTRQMVRNLRTGVLEPIKVAGLTDTSTSALGNLPDPLKPFAKDFEVAGAKYGVAPNILAAISMHETGNGTSPAFRNKNNAMGISNASGPVEVGSVSESIDKMARLLGEGINEGTGPYANVKSIADIANIYAPPGAGNDPRNLNQFWTQGVTSNIQKLSENQAEQVQPTTQNQGEIGFTPSKNEKTGEVMTQEQVNELVKQGAKLDAIPMADGRFIVSSMTVGGATPSVTEEIAVAKYNDEKQKREIEKAQGLAASARTLKLIDKYIDNKDGTATPALEDAVGFGESVGSFFGNTPFLPGGNKPEAIANQKELQLNFLEASILEASKALKPVSVDEMKFLQSNRPKITDKVEVWTQYMKKIKDTLSNPENYVQGSATESNDPVQEASRKLRGMLPQK